MNQRSIEIYRVKIEPTLLVRHQKVMKALEALGGEATSYEIAEQMGVPVHSISGRLSELAGVAKVNRYAKPVIEPTGAVRLNKYGNPCGVYRIRIPQEQPDTQHDLFQNDKAA